LLRERASVLRYMYIACRVVYLCTRGRNKKEVAASVGRCVHLVSSGL